MAASGATEEFRAARDFLLRYRDDYAAAYQGFVWPRPERFNWALDWFDVIAEGNDATALHIVDEDGTETRISFAEMSERSDRAANWLRAQGVGPGDRIVVMLGNQHELWETALAAMKLRAVVIPATPCSVRSICATASSAAGPRTYSYGPRTRPSSPRCPATTPGSRSARRRRAGSRTPRRTTPIPASHPKGSPAPTTR